MEAYNNFWTGFELEKDASLKKKLLSGLTAATMAASPAAKANSGEAVRHLRDAVKKTWGGALGKKPPKAIGKVKDISEKGVNISSGSSGPKIDIQDLSKLRVKSGDFTATLSGRGDVDAAYKLNKNLKLEGRKDRSGTYAGIAGRWDF